MRRGKIVVLLLVTAAIAAVYFVFDVGQYCNVAFLKSCRQSLQTYYHAHPALTVALYAGIYILVAALALPGVVVLTLAGGTLFGLWLGTVLVSFAAAIGATLALLASRYFLRDCVKAHFRSKLDAIDAGIARDGAFYLFTLRLVSVFPFFLVNLLMGLTNIHIWTYYWVSQLGMLLGIVVFVNVGTKLAQIDSMSDILSPAVLGSFALLGLLPLLAKKLLRAVQAT